VNERNFRAPAGSNPLQPFVEIQDLSRQLTHSLTPALLAVLAVLSLAGCSRNPAPATSDTAADAGAAAPPADATSGNADQAVALAAKEQELADREAAVKQQEIEAELARRNAESAQQASSAAAAAARKRPAKSPPATVAAAQPPAKAAPPPPPPPIVVPAGTPLTIELVAPVTTKTAAVGDRVQGRLASDLVAGGRLAAPAGSSVSGTVTQVVSGSKKIGGTPTLGITFDSLATGGGPVGISARLFQQGASDTGKDTAKVVGTTAAGAVIGHQVSHKNGAVVGGLLGGAAGLAIAQKTGSEVALAAGAVVNAPLDGAVQFTGS
jgi:hypothetical protein